MENLLLPLGDCYYGWLRTVRLFPSPNPRSIFAHPPMIIWLEWKLTCCCISIPGDTVFLGGCTSLDAEEATRIGRG